MANDTENKKRRRRRRKRTNSNTSEKKITSVKSNSKKQVNTNKTNNSRKNNVAKNKKKNHTGLIIKILVVLLIFIGLILGYGFIRKGIQKNNDKKYSEIIKNSKNDIELFEQLKKDNDYGKYYECKINDNKLGCYFKEELFKNDRKRVNKDELDGFFNSFDNLMNHYQRILNKFGVNSKIKDDIIYIAPEGNSVYADEFNFDEITDDNLILLGRKNTFICFHNGLCTNKVDNNTVKAFYLSDLNLMNPINVFDGLRYINSYLIDSFADLIQEAVYVDEDKVCDNKMENCKDYKYTIYDVTKKKINNKIYSFSLGKETNLSKDEFDNQYKKYVDSFTKECKSMASTGISFCKVQLEERISYYRCNEKNLYEGGDTNTSIPTYDNCKRITQDEYDRIG